MDINKYKVAEKIQNEIKEINIILSDINLFLSVLEQRPDKFNSDNISLSLLADWRDCPTTKIPVPSELYLTNLQMIKKNYMDRLTELTIKFEKI